MARRYRGRRIETCGDCPFFVMDSCFDGTKEVSDLIRCSRTKRSIDDVNGIPSWCPLVKAKD